MFGEGNPQTWGKSMETQGLCDTDESPQSLNRVLLFIDHLASNGGKSDRENENVSNPPYKNAGISY